MLIWAENTQNLTKKVNIDCIFDKNEGENFTHEYPSLLMWQNIPYQPDRCFHIFIEWNKKVFNLTDFVMSCEMLFW
jgi:hypothetical protein